MTPLRSKTNRFRMLALLAVAGATLSACSPTPAPSPTPTAAFASEEEAFAAAEEVYTEYNAAYNSIDYADPATFEALDDYTSARYQASEREGLSQMHAEGVARSGESLVVWFKGTELKSDGTIVARVCKDLSDVQVVDADGVSLVAPDRPDFSALELTFTPDDASGVTISDSRAVKDESCVSH